jgi:hypothetical protein
MYACPRDERWYCDKSEFSVVIGGLMKIGVGVVDRIIQANIDRFNLLLETEIDPAKRAMIIRLLAEEEEKRKQVKRGEKKAY